MPPPISPPGQLLYGLLNLPPALRARAFATAATSYPQNPASPKKSNPFSQDAKLSSSQAAHISPPEATDSSPSQIPPAPPPWRPSNVLDEWAQKEARPISLRQLTFFGRTLTESRLISSANYVRRELPTRIAHRLREDMQTLPYSALANPHMRHVYELYYEAFERLCKVAEIRTLEDNDRFCTVLQQCLREHLPVIPRLAMGILEIQDIVSADACDRIMNALLRSRISRRVIAEQHLALTDTFHAPWHFAGSKSHVAPDDDFVGEIFLKCNAKEAIEKCAATASALTARTYGPGVVIPEVRVQGHLDTTFPFIPAHLEYILAELLRNSMQAVVEQQQQQQHSATTNSSPPPPIEVLICEAAQHVILRISDRGGGIPRHMLPYLWSFAKGPRRAHRLRNLSRVPRLAATMEELSSAPTTTAAEPSQSSPGGAAGAEQRNQSSASATRPSDLRIGVGLPMSRIYAEYWAGSLELHSLEGYGCDVFLALSRLGNKNEVLSSRASMDGV